MQASISDDYLDEVKSGWAFVAQGHYDDAVRIFKDVLDNKAVHSAYHGLGRAYFEQGDVLRAVAALTHAVRIDKTDPDVYALMGDAYFSQLQVQPAVECYAQAVAYKPDDHDYRQKLVNAVSNFSIKKHINPNLKGVLLLCLEDQSLNFRHFGSFWQSVITNDKKFTRYYNLSKHKQYGAFKKSLDAMPLNGLIDPFFLTGLGRFIVPCADFERWLTYLRRYLLEAFVGNHGVFSDSEELCLLICALMRYCFLTDYVFIETAYEKEQVHLLEKRLLSEDDVPLHLIALYGCYRYLSTLENASSLSKRLEGGDHVSQIPKSQIEDSLVQGALKSKIKSITKIEDRTSTAVQGQYEIFPYPRWDVALKNLYNPEVEGYLKEVEGLEILNAGCGTGQEAIQLAYVFPNAKITAVDLSLSSLSYAQFKAKELGIDNVTFYQGDILKLDQFEQKFDYITSAGVLHHMENPQAGWKILCSLLKPSGLMRIALYSRRARWAINILREAITQNDIQSDAESIRAFRNSIQDYAKIKVTKNVQNFYDYYSLPECRDLLFHVQEHQFDLIEIDDILNHLDLEFLQFYLPQPILQKYVRQNQKDPEARDLKSWDAWEEKNANTFSSMYTFWCRSKKN